MTDRTPTPWKDREWRLYAEGSALLTDTEEGRRVVADVYGPGSLEFAALLVRAVNSHDALLAACKAMAYRMNCLACTDAFTGEDRIAAEMGEAALESAKGDA